MHITASVYMFIRMITSDLKTNIWIHLTEHIDNKMTFTVL